MPRNCLGFIKGFLPVKRRTSWIAALLVQLGLLLFLTFHSRSVPHLVSCSSELSMFSLNSCTTLDSLFPLHLGDLCPSHLEGAAHEAGAVSRPLGEADAAGTQEVRIPHAQSEASHRPRAQGWLCWSWRCKDVSGIQTNPALVSKTYQRFLLLNGCLGTAEDNSNVISF